jgi:two-component system sensor histidine kinase UhpB
MSLRFRLIFSIGLSLLASLAFGSTLTFWHAAHQVQTEMQAAMAVGEHIVRNAVDDSKQDNRRRHGMERLIAEFDGDRHLQASLVDRGNHVVLASKPEPPDSRVPGWFRRWLDGGSQTVKVVLPSDTEDYGAVLLAADASNELAEAWSDIGLALVVLVIFCTLVLGLIYWTLARGLRPLNDLNVGFVHVGRGDYAVRVAENGATELAHLAHEFNQMVARLSAMNFQNDRLNEQLTNVQEEERADLARELHDEIGPFLFAVSLDVSAMHQVAKDDVASQLAPRLVAIREAVVHMQKHLKLILGRLRPSVLLDLGLAQAVENLVNFWKGRHPNIVFDVQICADSFGGRLDEGIYRVLRESLSNALRHGHPSRIDVNIQLDAGDTVAITIGDDGGGMKPFGPAIGFGITGMQERVASLGGVLTIRNRIDGRGAIVTARFPLKEPSGFLTKQARETASA